MTPIESKQGDDDGFDIEALNRLIAQVEKRLRDNPDFQAFTSLTRARDALFSSQKASGAKTKGSIRGKSERSPASKLGQADAASQAIDQTGEPVPISDLVGKVRALGVKVGGKDPETNLSSVLSKSPEFRSVKWHGSPAWWKTGLKIPDEGAHRS
jgi:hypothetical protein